MKKQNIFIMTLCLFVKFAFSQNSNVNTAVQSLFDNGANIAYVLSAGYTVSDLYGTTYEGGVLYSFDTSTNTGKAVYPAEYGGGFFESQGSNPGTACSGSGVTNGMQGNFSTAQTLCDNLNVNGFNDWFLPNVSELQEVYYNMFYDINNPNNVCGSGFYGYLRGVDYLARNDASNNGSNCRIFFGLNNGSACGVPSSNVYNCVAIRNFTDGSSSLIDGCTDPNASNYSATATVDDGSCIYCVYGCADATQFNYDANATCDDGSCIPYTYGCTDASASNYNSTINTDDGSCIWLGCTDTIADNYDATATADDGSCTYSCNAPTNLALQTVIDVQAWVEWDEMSSSTGVSQDSVDFYKVLYRAVGDTTWLIKQKTFAGNQSPTVRVRLQYLLASTQYEMKIKAGYNSGCISDFSPISYFTTKNECLNIINFSASSTNSTKVNFNWDTLEVYSFLRIKLRVDTLNSSWMNAGGYGVLYPTTTKTKNGLIQGESYRAQARTWCDPNGGPYRSATWSTPIFWTQPTSLKIDGGLAIANLDIYPNPSRDVFNVAFTSEDVQDLEVRVINVVGEVIYSKNLQQFVGEHTKSLDLESYTKGVYFLEIITNNGLVNKKLILQ